MVGASRRKWLNGERSPTTGEDSRRRHCHSTLSLAVIDCHSLHDCRDLHDSLAAIAVIFCQNDSVAPG